MFQIKKRSFALIVAISFLAGASVPASVLYIMQKDKIMLNSKEYSQVAKMSERFDKANKLYDLLDRYYYDEYDKESIIDGICYGLYAGTGDPYTSYLTQDQYEKLKIQTSGELQGIGVVCKVDEENRIVIGKLIEGGPAEKAGLKPNDIILEIDGEVYRGDKYEDAISAMRGDAGTKVKIAYLRGERQSDVSIIRGKIQLQSVHSQILKNNIGYIYISNFESNTGNEFDTAIRQMEVKGVDGVVIDLRDNGGGVVAGAIQVADRLLDEGVLAYTEGKNEEKTFLNTENGKTSLPYVLLINENTASASEIIAAGIKDSKGGAIVGTKSFGKGVIQTIKPLTDGSAVKITVAQYFSPKGKVIQKVGVEPDFYVEMEENGNDDAQLNKAVELLTNRAK